MYPRDSAIVMLAAIIFYLIFSSFIYSIIFLKGLFFIWHILPFLLGHKYLMYSHSCSEMLLLIVI